MSTSTDPVLPDGIKISSEGFISGSVVDNFDTVVFSITFYNLNAINALTSCYYNVDKDVVFSFVKGEPTRIKVSCQRKPQKFITLDELPKGLILYEDSGIIAGSAEEIQESTTYSIVASNSISSLNIKVNIRVIEKRMSMFLPKLEYRVSDMDYSQKRGFDPSKPGRWHDFENETEIPNQYLTYLPVAYFINGDVFEMRWRNMFGRMHGYLYCSRTGIYTFNMNADDLMQFYFENMSEIAVYNRDWSEWVDYTPPHELKAGNYYEIGALFYQQDGGFNMHINWKLKDEAEYYQIPEENLFHVLEHITDLTYPQNTYIFKRNEEFSITYSKVNGNPTSWSIRPDLPPGITFAQGKISGKTTSIITPTLYTITASNDLSSSSYQIGLVIVNDEGYSRYNHGAIVSYYTRNRDDCNYEYDKYPGWHWDMYFIAIKRIETNLNYEYRSESYDGLPGYLNEKFNVDYSYYITLDTDGNYEYDIETTDNNYFWMYSEWETGAPSFTSPVVVNKGDRMQTSIRAYLKASTIEMWMTSCRKKGIYPTGGSINMAGGPEQIERQPIPPNILNYVPPSPFHYTYLFARYVSRAKITPNEPLYHSIDKNDFDVYMVDPPLPYGLSLNTQNGIISGTPFIEEQGIKKYIITAMNSKTKFSAYATIEIAVVKLPIPANLMYFDTTTGYEVNSIEYAVNQEINPLRASLDNSEAVRFYTEPSLPAGITIDPYTGAISGKPRQTYGSIVTIYADRKGLMTSTTLTVIIKQCGEGLQYFEIHFDVRSFSSSSSSVRYTVYRNRELLSDENVILPSNTKTIFSNCGVNTLYQLNIKSNIINNNDDGSSTYLPPSYYVYIGSTLIHYEQLKSGYQNIDYAFSNSIPGLPSLIFNNNNTLWFYNYLEASHTGHIVNGIDSVSIEPPLPKSLSFDITTMTVKGIVNKIGDSFHNFILKNSKGTSNIAVRIHSTTCPEDKTAFYIYFYGNDKSSQAQVNFIRNTDRSVLLDYRGTLEQYKRTAWYFCEVPDTYTLTLDSNDGSTWDGATTISVYLEGHIEMYFGKFRSSIPENNRIELDLDLLATPSSSWKYHYSDEADPGYGWKDVNFYDKHWDISTPGNYKRRYGITSYYRKIVDIESLDQISSFQAAFQFDGGIVAYINGIEFYRFNLPNNDINYNTLPLVMYTKDEEIYFHHVSGPIEYLKVGKNILAIEIHIINDTDKYYNNIQFNPFGGMFDTIKGSGEKSCRLKTSQRIQTVTNMGGGWLSENPGLLLDGDNQTPFAGEGKNRYVDFYYPDQRREYINSYRINGVRYYQDVRSPIEWQLYGFNELTNEFELIHNQPEYELNNNGNTITYYLPDAPKRSYNRFRWSIVRTGAFAPGDREGWLETTDFLFYTCSIQICPEVDEWPETGAGSTAYISCPINYFGKIPRECLTVDGKATWGRIPQMSEYCTAISFSLQFERVIFHPNEILYNRINHEGLECSNIYLTTTNPPYVVINDNRNAIISTDDALTSVTQEEEFNINVAATCVEPGKNQKIYDASFVLVVKKMPIPTIPFYFYFLNSNDEVSTPNDLVSRNENMIIRYSSISFDSVDDYHVWYGMPEKMLKNFVINGVGYIHFNKNGTWTVTIEYQGSIRVEYDNKVILEDEDWDNIKTHSFDINVYSDSILKQFSLFYIGRYYKRKYLKILSKHPVDGMNIHNGYYSVKESSAGSSSNDFNYNAKKYICEIGRDIMELKPVISSEIENSIFGLINSLPKGLRFDVVKGVISGTPAETFDGKIEIKATVGGIEKKAIVNLIVQNTPPIPSMLDLYDCSDNKVSELIFIKSSYLPCDGYKIKIDQPMKIGLFPEYDNLELNITDKTINYYSDILEDKLLYIFGETEYGEKILTVNLKVIDCRYTTYTIELISGENTNGDYIFKEKNGEIVNEKDIESESTYNLGICSTESHNLTVNIKSGEIHYILKTFDGILLEDEVIVCNTYPCNHSVVLDPSNEPPEVNHQEYIQYEANKKKIISPTTTKLISYKITNSFPDGIEMRSNGIITVLLPLCADYNLNVLAENQQGRKEYVIKLRCISCEGNNQYKLFFSKLLDVGSSKESIKVYNSGNGEEIYNINHGNSGPIRITNNFTLCLSDDVEITVSDEDSGSWNDNSLLTIYTPLEMVLNQVFYNNKIMKSNNVHINKPILNYDKEWRIDYKNDYSSNQVWLNINYDDSSWISCVYPNCDFSDWTSNELKINMRQKLFIDNNVGELIFDFIYNDSFVLIINNHIIETFNGKVLLGNIVESVTYHPTFHNTTTISNEYFKEGEYNIICIYYHKITPYDPLVQVAIYPIYYDSLLGSLYYPSSKDLFDLLPDTQKVIQCSNNVKIPFGFHVSLLFNSYRIYSSILTQDIKWSIYASLSSSNNVYLSSGYGRFDEDSEYIIPHPIASNSFYIQIDDCNSIRQFSIKDINITLNHQLYCSNHPDGYFATSVNHYSVIPCQKPLFGVVKRACVVNNNGGVEWSDVEDDSMCDYEAPESLSLENDMTIIKTYLNGEFEKIKVNNYNIKQYQDVYITPELPSGILFDKENGIIYGKPNGSVINQLYSLLVYNKNGRKYLLFNISVRGLTDDFSYPFTSALINTEVYIKPNQIISAESVYIYPPLPNGLNINELGEVNGKLSLPNENTVFYVNYENPAGEMGSELNIVISGVPTVYNYFGTPFEISQSIYFNSGPPIIRGVIDHYTCESLPVGLEINGNTGIISGNPQIIETSTHRCTARNTLGSITSSFTFKILERTCKADGNNNIWGEALHGTWETSNQLCGPGTTGIYLRYCSDDLIPQWGESIENCIPNAPSSLRYDDNPLIYSYQRQGNHYLPHYNGIIRYYDITPSLPKGLLFNTTTGEISGKPEAVLTGNFLVTGINENGRVSTVVTLIINGRYCKTDGKWPETLIGSYFVSQCDSDSDNSGNNGENNNSNNNNNMDGLAVRYCNGSESEEWWENVTDHCLPKEIDYYDTSFNYYKFNISFYNVSFVNDSNVDYLLTQFLEYSTDIFPVVFVSKYFEETDRYLRLYTITYQFKYKVKVSRRSEYLSSLDQVVISPLFQEYMYNEIPQLGINNIEANTELIEHLSKNEFINSAGFIVLMIFVCLIIIGLIAAMVFGLYKYKVIQQRNREKEDMFALNKQRSRIIIGNTNLAKSESVLSISNRNQKSISPDDVSIPPNLSIPSRLSQSNSTTNIIRMPPFTHRIAPDDQPYSFASSTKRSSRMSSKVAPSPTCSIQRTLSGFNPVANNNSRSNRYTSNTQSQSVSGILKAPTNFSSKYQKIDLNVTSPLNRSRAFLKSPNSPSSPTDAPLSPTSPIAPFSPSASRKIPLQTSKSVKLVRGSPINGGGSSSSMVYTRPQSVDLRKFAVKGSGKFSPSKSSMFGSTVENNESLIIDSNSTSLLSPHSIGGRKKRLLTPHKSRDDPLKNQQQQQQVPPPPPPPPPPINDRSQLLLNNNSKSERLLLQSNNTNTTKKRNKLMESISHKNIINDLDDEDDLEHEIHFNLPDFSNNNNSDSFMKTSSKRDQISELLGTTNLGGSLHSGSNNTPDSTKSIKLPPSSSSVVDDDLRLDDIDDDNNEIEYPSTLKINDNDDSNEMKKNDNEFDVIELPKEPVAEENKRECVVEENKETKENDVKVPDLKIETKEITPLKSPRAVTPRKTPRKTPRNTPRNTNEEKSKDIPDLRINTKEITPLKSPRALTPRKNTSEEKSKDIPDLRINTKEITPLKSPRALTPKKTPKNTPKENPKKG